MNLFEQTAALKQSDDIPEHIHDKIGFLLHREFMGDQKCQDIKISGSQMECREIFTDNFLSKNAQF